MGPTDFWQMAFEMFAGLLAVIGTGIWWWMRTTSGYLHELERRFSDETARADKEHARIELKLAEDYVTRSEHTASRSELSEAIATFSEKIDKLIALVHQKADRE